MSEQLYQRGNLGWIEVICGSMFSGKSEELIRRLRRAQIAKQRVQIFKARLDTRFSPSGDDHIVSHSDMKIKSQIVNRASDILELLDSRTQVVGIDEGQFFDLELVGVCNKLARPGLPRPAFRPDAPAPVDCGVHYQDARHLRVVRRSGKPNAADSG
jgi:thymidine kinase